MWAMPATRVENTSGAMIILISRRKTSVMIERFVGHRLGLVGAGVLIDQPSPTATPSTMAPTMKDVKSAVHVDAPAVCEDAFVAGKPRLVHPGGLASCAWLRL